MAAQGGQRSPREILAAAIASGFMTPDERARFRSQKAAVRAQDEAKRAEPAPQFDLELAA